MNLRQGSVPVDLSVVGKGAQWKIVWNEWTLVASKEAIVLTKDNRPDSGSINVARQNCEKHSSVFRRECRTVDATQEMNAGGSVAAWLNAVIRAGVRLSRCGCG